MDTSGWGTPIELSSHAEAGPYRYVEPPEPVTGSRALHGRRVAAALVMVGFVLVGASQLLPWITVVGGAGIESDLGPVGGREFATADGASVLLFAYDVIWLPVMALSAMCVFAHGPRQRALFAAGVAALATQVTLMLPMLTRPGRIVGQASLFETGGLRADLGAGAYFAVAAVLVLAGSLVLAVNGRVLPTGDDGPPATAGYQPAAGYDGGEVHPVDMHAALAASQPHRDERADIDYGPPPATAVSYDTPPRQATPATVDHSMYARPRTPEENRG
jgi:hypothetical protein